MFSSNYRECNLLRKFAHFFLSRSDLHCLGLHEPWLSWSLISSDKQTLVTGAAVKAGFEPFDATQKCVFSFSSQGLNEEVRRLHPKLF